MKVDILAIAVHPDDIELACSGTIIKAVKNGKKVAILDLTQGELGTRGTLETRAEEAENASRIMGVSQRTILNMGDGFFTHSKENLLQIAKYIRFHQPEIVIANAVKDRHPDHGRAGKLIADACFYSGLQKVKTQFKGKNQTHWRPKNVYHMIQDYYQKPDFVVDISDFWELKLESILAYKSQFYNPNSKEPMTPISSKEFLAFLQGRASQFGREIHKKYGEGFTMDRTPGIDQITDLI